MVGPGISARRMCMVRSGAFAEMMVTNTRIPMPPIQWVKQRQNCME